MLEASTAKTLPAGWFSGNFWRLGDLTFSDAVCGGVDWRRRLIARWAGLKRDAVIESGVKP